MRHNSDDLSNERLNSSKGEVRDLDNSNIGLIIFGLLFFVAGAIAIFYWGYRSVSWEVWAAFAAGALSILAGVYRIWKGMP